MKTVKSTLFGFAVSMSVIYGSLAGGEAIARHAYRAEMLPVVEPYFTDTGNLWYRSPHWSDIRAQYVKSLDAAGHAGRMVAVVVAGSLLLVGRLAIAARKDSELRLQAEQDKSKADHNAAIVAAAEDLAAAEEEPAKFVEKAYTVAGLASRSLG
jgi:hypothetical protein